MNLIRKSVGKVSLSRGDDSAVGMVGNKMMRDALLYDFQILRIN